LDFDDLQLDHSRMGRGGFSSESFSGRIRGRNGRLKTNNMFKFLGIHWGQFPEAWELQNKARLKETRKSLILDGAYVDGLSGMTCVIPAWQIMEVLEMPKLVSLREPVIDAVHNATPGLRAPKPESVEKPSAPDDEVENPQHLEDFTSLLNAAAKTKPQGD
jgi:hypothetical protein